MDCPYMFGGGAEFLVASRRSKKLCRSVLTARL
jgi:hypothetical protein